jgi:ornithine carbamoyltransferase
MSVKDLLSIHDLSTQDVSDLVAKAIHMKAEPEAYRSALAGKVLGMIFMKSSTRTRVSFETGIFQMGGMGLFLSSRDIQIGRGEPISDTAQVLSRYIDGIMARVFEHQDVIDLARFGSIPVINGLTDLLHPCQALADLQSVHEHFGKTEGLTMAYVGDGNNMAHSLMFAASKAGMNFVCVSPDGYEMDSEMVALGRQDAEAAGTSLLCTPERAGVEGAHVVYSDVWASMGQEDEQQIRLRDFNGYIVDSSLMAMADKEAVFMHCLPAHRGEEVSTEVCDGSQSIIFDQAENRLHMQKAIMLKLMAS